MPVDAVTLPVKSPVTLPVTLPVRLPVTLPVTLPVSAPVMPALALTVVKLPAARVVPPITTLSAVPPLMSAEASVACPDVVNVVNAPVDAELAPIAVPSIAPPLISAAPITTEPVPAGVSVMLPSVFVAEMVFASSLRLSTRRSVTAEFVPMVTPSIDPPLMSAVVTVPRLLRVAPAKVTVPFAERLVKSAVALVELPMSVPSIEPALISTVVATRLVVVTAPAVVPPIVTPSIVPPLISAVSAMRLSMLAVPSRKRSLNCLLLEPRSMSSSVVGSITPSLMMTCSTGLLLTST